MKIDVDDWYVVDRTHRVGPPPSDISRPRQIIAWFLQDKAKSAILTVARKKKQVIWKDAQICFFQDYTQDVQENLKKFDEVRCLCYASFIDSAL